MPGFSDFHGRGPAAFPVEWLDFQAEARGNAVRLEWATVREENSDFFAVERSNKSAWEILGLVAAAGNSSAPREYSYLDQAPKTGSNYYCLRQADLDGKTSYSSVVEVRFEKGSFEACPNPVRDWLTVAGSGEAALEVRIFDLSGREVRRVELGGSSGRVSLEGLPTGVYSVRVQLEGGQARNIPFVKE